MERHLWKGVWERGAKMDSGAQGHVHRARRLSDPSGQFNYVIKELKRQDDEKARKRMNAEVAALQLIAHQNVVQFVDSNASEWEKDVELYLITTFVDGPNLDEYIKKVGPLEIDAATQLLFVLLETVETCHQLGQMHRDIKPLNIILRGGVVTDPVLLDFGITFNHEYDEEGAAVTEIDEAFGSKFLRLPELESGSAYKRDFTTDRTALVGILYFVLTGEYPSAILLGDGKRPHQRQAAAFARSKLGRYQASVLDTIWDVGFQEDRGRRWPSNQHLRNELLKLKSGKAAIPDDFKVEDRVKQLWRVLADDDGERRRVQVSDVANGINSATTDFLNVVQSSSSGRLHVTPQVSSSFGGAKRKQSTTLTIKRAGHQDLNYPFLLSCEMEGEDVVIRVTVGGADLAPPQFIRLMSSTAADDIHRACEWAMSEALEVAVARFVEEGAKAQPK